MARRGAELAILGDAMPKAGPVSIPAEAEVSALEDEIVRRRNHQPAALLDYVVERICSLTHSDGAAVAIRDGLEVVCRASTGNAPAVGSRPSARFSLTWECLETGREVISEDTQNDRRIDRAIARSLRLGAAVSFHWAGLTQLSAFSKYSLHESMPLIRAMWPPCDESHWHSARR